MNGRFHACESVRGKRTFKRIISREHQRQYKSSPRTRPTTTYKKLLLKWLSCITFTV